MSTMIKAIKALRQEIPGVPLSVAKKAVDIVRVIKDENGIYIPAKGTSYRGV